MSIPPERVRVLGDPRIPWVVLLDVDLTDQPSPTALTRALADIAAERGASPGRAGAVSRGTRRELLDDLCEAAPEVLRVGLHDRGLILAARHDVLDGLGMLVAVGRLLGEEMRSSARGLDPAGRAPDPARALFGRAWEVILRPQATVARSALPAAGGDAFARVTIDGATRTADLVHAGSRAVVAWNRRHAARARRVTVAVGVSTVAGSSPAMGDHSAFLRLRGVELMTREEVGVELARAPLQLGGFAPTLPRALSAATAFVFRISAMRLGSTLLVSNLGVIDAPDIVDELTFYPVTGGGSGLSLGAVTVKGRTTLTLRARAARHDDEGLRQLLALVVEELDRARDQSA